MRQILGFAIIAFGGYYYFNQQAEQRLNDPGLNTNPETIEFTNFQTVQTIDS